MEGEQKRDSKLLDDAKEETNIDRGDKSNEGPSTSDDLRAPSPKRPRVDNVEVSDDESAEPPTSSDVLIVRGGPFLVRSEVFLERSASMAASPPGYDRMVTIAYVENEDDEPDESMFSQSYEEIDINHDITDTINTASSAVVVIESGVSSEDDYDDYESALEDFPSDDDQSPEN